MLERLSCRPRPPYTPWAPAERCSFPQGRSVLVGALTYAPRVPGAMPGKGRGYLSPFAQEPDYHHLVADKLGRLAAFILRLAPDCRWSLQVDSGPGCERLYALAAGVGWQGKNNFIIVPGVGSYVWLGLLVTDLALPPDTPLASKCGDCDLCLRACPTQAYEGPNAFAHTRCLAYWLTAKTPLSPEEQGLLNRHRLLYGCDYCQRACPYNPPGEGADEGLDIRGLLALSPDQFKAYFEGTAALWRGSAVLRRNLVLAAGKSPDCRELLVQIAREQGLAGAAAREVLSAWEKGPYTL